ncbi:MAG TPA: serine hydrolase domain-containing protein [Pseudonocardiaceae bacterium]|nr:serine hydrolase domain-containing protein [Pseudonocardiaceae bacterium]
MNKLAGCGEAGAALCVYNRGRCVMDLRGGAADPVTGAPWAENTLQYVFSTTKGFTAACAHLSGQRGELDPDAPVAGYWPEFAAAGKQHIPVRWLLSHRAGLAALDSPCPWPARSPGIPSPPLSPRGIPVGAENLIRGLWPAPSRPHREPQDRAGEDRPPCSCDCPTSPSPAWSRFCGYWR